jgi:hypothetical protein
MRHSARRSIGKSAYSEEPSSTYSDHWKNKTGSKQAVLTLPFHSERMYSCESIFWQLRKIACCSVRGIALFEHQVHLYTLEGDDGLN